ncbi:MAG: S-layer homology domain-containing protein [bacterium]|nr:S-layer homology domain-containing protein [bacterium]
MTRPVDRRCEARYPRRQQARTLLVVFTVLLMVGGLLPDLTLPALAGGTGELVSSTGGEGGTSHAAEQFSDIAGSGVHRANVEILAAWGIFEGTGCAAGLFCPGLPIEGWAVAVWLVRALEGTDPAPMDRSRFADVDEGAWWAVHVERLADLEVTKGCDVEPARFCPDSPVTRAQMATFLTRAFRLPSVPDAGFTDVGQSATHLPDINSLAAASITSGCAVDPARYCPGRATTRAQMATFLTRALRFAGAIPSGDASTLLPPDEGDFTAVAVGWDHSCGLRRDRTVTCWGDNGKGQAAPPDGEFVAVAAGRSHTCGIDARQEIVCWGWDGRGATEAPEGRFIAVTAGGDHSCAIRTDRSVACWGADHARQADPPPGEFAAIAAGEWHTCGLSDTDQTLTCWGADNDGQADPPPGRFVAIAAGNWHSCGVRTDGVGVCWGADHAAQANVPAKRFRAIAAGWQHSCGVITDSSVVCWGYDEHGRADPPEGTFSAIALGDRHSCGLHAGGAITCWGQSPEDGRTAPTQVIETPVEVYQYVSPGQPDPDSCRPPGPAGFPLRSRIPSTGTVRVAVLFLDFPDAQARHTTRQEAELGLPYIETYLETASYGLLKTEFTPLHRWLRAPHGYRSYLGTSTTPTRRTLLDPDAEAVRLADPEFDFTDHDAVMVVMPSSHFGNGLATGSIRTEEGPLSRVRINFLSVPEPRQPLEWGLVAAHELAHMLGLLDLYPSDSSLRDHPVPPPGRRWVANQIGLMGLWANFLASVGDPRLAHEIRLPDGRRHTAHAYDLQAREMLAWSRWQLGWLQPGQVRCVTGLETGKTVTVALQPVASPGFGTAMVGVPLSDTEIVIIESRRRIGFDAGHEYRYGDGATTTLPTLAGGGVLVYVVDAARSAGQMPIRVIGHSGNPYPILHFKEYPLLTEGESISVGGYTITVRSADDRTDVFTITRDS